MEMLLPACRESRDFFVCDLFTALPYFKDDLASMEHPVFSLSTKLDKRTLYYESNGNTVTIIPSTLGLATIHDKDILLYCASHLRAAINEGKNPSPYIRFTAYDFFTSTNRHIGGQYYKNFEMALNRLRGTTINTNVTTGGIKINKGFGLIDSWEAIKRDDKNRAVAIKIKVSDWFYNAVIANEVLTINQAYFKLRKPLERRIYELARKHCGDNQSFKISLIILQKKVGSGSTPREFRRLIGKLLEKNHLPDYKVSLSENIITFVNSNWKTPISEKQYAWPLLKPETFAKARVAAPGWDVYALEQEWREWISKKEPTKCPDTAFVAFCRKRFQKQGRP